VEIPLRRAIQTAAAPAAIGPYSQAIASGDMLWLSGQIALDPESMILVGETAAEQAVQVMKNLGAVLSAAGFGFEHLVQCTIFLKDMDDFNAVNEVYARYMPTPPPARATVEVSRLPKDVRVEIGATARREQ
jgi:2-iminobutanoate/2-iminopropanoate deaminase